MVKTHMRLGMTVAAAVLVAASAASAYIEAAYTVGRFVKESTIIALLEVEKIDSDRNLIIYKKVRDLKGKCPDVIKVEIGRLGFHPREWQFIMAGTKVGGKVVFCSNGSASETCMENYWYQCYPGGEWWRLNHAEPYLLRTFAGKPEKFAQAVEEIIAGKEVVVPCMADGDKNALALRSGKMQRMKASLAIQEYDVKRDFMGWGNEEFRRLASMPGFAAYGGLGQMEGRWSGVSVADFNGDGTPDVCLWSDAKVSVQAGAANSMDEVSLPYAGGARAGCWGDYNGDAKPDLLLATPTGPKLLTNENGSFKDSSDLLPKEPYYNITGALWTDFDGDGKAEVLLANGFLGLRMYKYNGKVFDDISTKVGLGPAGAGSRVKGDHLAAADVNNDGRMDFLYCAGKGLLALNTPQGFVEMADSGLDFQAGRIQPAFGDFNSDKSIDLFVPQAGSCKLYQNDGKGKFVEVTSKAGELAAFKGDGACGVFADFRKTGRMDLLIGCVKGPNRYFRNQGDGTFVDAGDELGLYQRAFNTRAMCVLDYNRDGVNDLVMSNEGLESAMLLGAASR